MKKIQKVVPVNDRILKLRETEGFVVARKIATKEAMIDALHDATTIDDLKSILLTMLED